MKKKKINNLKTESKRFLNTLEKSIEIAITETRLNADIDKDKENDFYISSKESIIKAFEKFDVIKKMCLYSYHCYLYSYLCYVCEYIFIHVYLYISICKSMCVYIYVNI